MNNTSRFKFYGILTALILVAVGVVWFYPRKEHSSKVPRVKKDGAAQQVTRPPQQRLPQQPITSSTLQSDADEFQKTLDMVMGKSKVDLTSDQTRQAYITLDAIRNDIMEMLAGNASYQQIDDYTIVIKTRLSQAQADEIENRLYTEMRAIVGDDKLRLLDDGILNGLRQRSSMFGTGERKYTIIGMSTDDLRVGKYIEQPLNIAESFVVKAHYNLASDVSYESEGQYYSKDSVIQEMGKMGAVALKRANEVEN